MAKSKTYKVQASTDREENDLQIAQARYRAMAAMPGGTVRFRENKAYHGNLADRFTQLSTGFSADSGGAIPVAEAIRLSQLAYFNNGIVGNVIDVMQEFTVNSVDFRSNKKQSREVMLGWAKGTKLKTFLDQVALEYYRSGNVYIYRFVGTIKDSSVRGLQNLFGIKGSVKVPIRYTIINPTMMQTLSSGMSDQTKYQISIPAEEAQLILETFKKNPEAMISLPPEFQAGLKQMGERGGRVTRDLLIDLNPDNVIAIHRKKQPYERYAVPFIARALDDVVFKSELRAMDRALARVLARILIHVKVGTEILQPSPESLKALQDRLANATTSTYLITDGTVSIQQYYPDVAALLDNKKYGAVNEDIFWALGVTPAAMGNGSGSYSNNFLGIKVLIERIADGRTKIEDEFLIPECEMVASAFNLRADIEPQMIGVNLSDEQEWQKIYTRLYELGVFSAQSRLEALDTGRIPSYDEEIERQTLEKPLKEEGLFTPVLNPGGNSSDAGRPSGVKDPPQTSPVKKTPDGANVTNATKEVVKIRAFTQVEFDECKDYVTESMKEKHGLKRLSKDQKEVIAGICRSLLVSEPFSKEAADKVLSNLMPPKV